MGCIYKITNTVNNKLYVGYTTGLFSKRMNQHKNDDYHYDTLLGRAINKYGWDVFKCEIIHEESDKEKLLELERYYIKLLNSKTPNGYNLTDGGERLFDESNPFWNHRHSDEAKIIMSEKASLRTGMLNPFYGKHHSDTTKHRISEANSKAVLALGNDKQVVKEFRSLSEASDWCLELGLTSSKYANSDISKRCKDGRKSFGYYWRYRNEDVETMPDECKAVG